jgi:uncharacterized protein YjiS (DUF1127 family)
MNQATSRCTLAGAYRAPAPAASGTAIGRLAAAVGWFVDQWRRTQAIRELNRLSDHHLRDIGIARADIEAVAEEMIRRRRG